MKSNSRRRKSRIRSSQTSDDHEQRLDMSSLIDVSFLLLIYFVVTSSIDPKESDIGLTLPGKIGGSNNVEFDPMYIKVTSNNEIFLNTEKVESADSGRQVPHLVDRLRTYVDSYQVFGQPLQVTISAGDGARSQRFIDVLNALADEEVGIQEVSLEMD